MDDCQQQMLRSRQCLSGIPCPFLGILQNGNQRGGQTVLPHLRRNTTPHQINDGVTQFVRIQLLRCQCACRSVAALLHQSQ